MEAPPSPFDVRWTEKFPIDVMAMIVLRLFDRRCGICGCHYIHEFRNAHVGAFAQTCRRARLAWSRAVFMVLRQPRDFPMCLTPNVCLLNYTRRAPRLPFLWVHSPDRRAAEELDRVHRRSRSKVSKSGLSGGRH